MPEKGYTQRVSTADFTDTPNLSFEQPVGDVSIEGWDRPEIEVSIPDDGMFEIEQKGSEVIVKNRPGKFKLVDFLEDAGVEFRDYGVDLSRAASQVERTVERTVEKGIRRMGRNFNFNVDLSNWKGGRDYHIMVPHSCDLTLRTSSGDVEITGVEGTMFVQSSSGDIKARIISGNTLLTTASGDITIEDLEGKLAVRTASGDIRTRTLGVQEVSASTASGDLDLDLTRLPEGNFDVKTISGSLNLFVPAASSFNAEIHTISGSVACGFPRSAVEYAARHKRETNLKVNGGGKNLEVTTVSGDVTIRPRRSEAQPSAHAAMSVSVAAPPARTVRTGGAHTMDLSRSNENNPEASENHGDIVRPEPSPERQQAELEILQQVERGELTPQEALTRLSALDTN